MSTIIIYIYSYSWDVKYNIGSTVNGTVTPVYDVRWAVDLGGYHFGMGVNV